MKAPEIEDIHGFREKLMQWYDAEKRDLPWRQPGTTPYGIWVSEVMLQQTQVSRVIDYWTKWMGRFPDVYALAKADINEVYSYWSGLGYYRRAFGLHKGAQYLIDNHKGEIPQDHAALLKVPSVGPYIAAAVLSSAYNVPAAAVDANIMRVYARVHRFEKFDLNHGDSRKTIQAIADKAFDSSRCVEWNQAIMDLGAQICKPRDVNCAACPLKDFCSAYKWQQATKADSKMIPQLHPLSRNTILDKKTKEISDLKRSDMRRFAHVASAVVFDANSKAWMNIRPKDGLLANLWDFPTITFDKPPGKSFKQNTAKKLELVLKSQNIAIKRGLLYAGSVVHIFSHIRMQVEVFVANNNSQVKEEADDETGKRWICPSELSSIGISSLAKKILDASRKSQAFCGFTKVKEPLPCNMEQKDKRIKKEIKKEE